MTKIIIYSLTTLLLVALLVSHTLSNFEKSISGILSVCQNISIQIRPENNVWLDLGQKLEYDQEIPQSHTPDHEEPQNTNSHKTPGRQLKL